MSLVELTFPKHTSSPMVFSFSIFSLLCSIVDSLFVFLFLFFWPLCIVGLRLRVSDYLFGVFKLSLSYLSSYKRGSTDVNKDNIIGPFVFSLFINDAWVCSNILYDMAIMKYTIYTK